MNDFTNKKQEDRSFKISQANLLLKFIEQKRKDWSFADLSEQLAYDKNIEDILLISNSLFEWSEKAPPDKKSKLEDLFLGTLRINSYCTHLEVVVKKAVSELSNERKSSDRMSSEKRILQLEKKELENEIEKLKKQIEFSSPNNR